MALRYRVIVVGSVNIDLVVRVERLPAPGETVTGGRFARHQGGKGGNQAVAAARLGAPTSFVGAVGADDHGTAARAALAADGVDVDELRALPQEATGVALILVDASGENSIAVAGGANAALEPRHVRESLERLAPGPGDVVLVGHEIPTTTATEALRAAKSAGATAIFNPAPAIGIGPDTLALSDLLTPNQGEAALLAAQDGDPEAVATVLLAAIAAGGHVLLTLGSRGALLVGAEGVRSIPPPDVPVVDTVGAGDTLNGALAAGLAAGLPMRDAVRRAVAAASLSITRAGAREGMPTARELEALLTG